MAKNSSIKYHIKETDLLLYITCILTSAFGALMVYSATLHDAVRDGDAITRECLLMIIASGVGILACFFSPIMAFPWRYMSDTCFVAVSFR